MDRLFFLLNAGFTAANAAFYSQNGSPANLSSAVFCGLITLYFLLKLVRA